MATRMTLSPKHNEFVDLKLFQTKLCTQLEPIIQSSKLDFPSFFTADSITEILTKKFASGIYSGTEESGHQIKFHRFSGLPLKNSPANLSNFLDDKTIVSVEIIIVNPTMGSFRIDYKFKEGIKVATVISPIRITTKIEVGITDTSKLEYENSFAIHSIHVYKEKPIKPTIQNSTQIRVINAIRIEEKEQEEYES